MRAILFLPVLVAATVGVLAASAPSARAELWQGAVTQPKDDFALGGYGQVYGQTYALPAAVMFFGQFTYGLSDDLQLEARLGFGMINTYVGFFGKFRLLHARAFTLSLLAGGHFQNGLSADADLIGSVETGAVEWYLAPVLEVSTLPLGSSPAQLALGLIPGADVRVSRSLKVYLEFDVNLYGYYYAGSLGLRRLF